MKIVYDYTMKYNLLKSRTFWTIILMFIVGGGNAIVPVLPAAYQALVQGVLGILAIYFHQQTAVTTGATN